MDQFYLPKNCIPFWRTSEFEDLLKNLVFFEPLQIYDYLTYQLICIISDSGNTPKPVFALTDKSFFEKDQELINIYSYQKHPIKDDFWIITKKTLDKSISQQKVHSENLVTQRKCLKWRLDLVLNQKVQFYSNIYEKSCLLYYSFEPKDFHQFDFDDSVKKCFELNIVLNRDMLLEEEEAGDIIKENCKLSLEEFAK